MDKILNLDSVDLYNKLYGLETLNPLVSVIDLNKATSSVDFIRFNYGIYALYLKLEKACDIKYGRQTYDYQEGTIVCFAPGQTAETNPTTDKVQVNAHGILFHPDLLRGTSLGKNIKKYTFFSYEVNEALHLSEEERSIVMDCLKIIRMELEHGVDKHSKTLLVNHIELLLNYCMRFYERQFITRGKTNRDVLTRFENLLDEYFESTLAEQDGLPTVNTLPTSFASHRTISVTCSRGNRQITAGIHPRESNRASQRTYLRHGGHSQPNRIFPRFPISAALLSAIQETGRVHAK